MAAVVEHEFNPDHQPSGVNKDNPPPPPLCPLFSQLRAMFNRETDARSQHTLNNKEEHCERKTLRCLSKMIECPLECGHLVLRQWEFQHRTFDCPKRPAMCPGGCSADVTADEADTHFMTCGRRRIR